MYDPTLAQQTLVIIGEKPESDAVKRIKGWLLKPDMKVLNTPGVPIPHNVYWVQCSGDVNAIPKMP